MAEEELYSQRAKLFCFRDNDWRERGLGDAKLLKHPEKGVRLFMTQQSTGKIIANCLVVEHSTYYDLRPNAGSDKCWVFSAQDCSEEELQIEQFALKFGSKEFAQAFQVAFDKAKVTNTAMGVPLREEVRTAQETVSSTSPFANLAGCSPFSPAARPFAAPSAGGSGGLFSSPGSGGGLFVSAGGLFGSMSFSAVSSAPATGGSGSMFTTATVGTATGGLFGSLGSASGGQASSTGGTGGSLFGSSSGSQAASSGGSGGSLFGAGSLFGSYGSTSGSLTSSTAGSFAAATGGLFGSFGSQTACAGGSGGLFTAPATGSISSGLGSAPAEPAAQGDDDAEEEVTTVPGWEPSVTLPVLEKVVTGEEDEEELYSQRSKLLRFRDGEWKERGLGEARLLQHRQSKMVRFFMRQERTGKIVANHFVVDAPSCCKLRPNASNPKCLVWMVQDYADEEPVVEQFALKFGTPELASDFKDAFNRAKELNANAAAKEDAEPAPAAAEEKKTAAAAAGNAAAAESAADSSAAGGSAAQTAAKEAPEMYKLLLQLQRKVEEQEVSHKLEIAELNASWEAKFEGLQRGSGQELALAERDRAKAQVCSLLSNLQENFEEMMAQVSQVQREVSGSGPACLADAPAVNNSSSARTVNSLEKKVETLCSLLSTLAEELRSTDERLVSRLAEQKAATDREVAQLRDSVSPELAALLKRVSTLQRSFRREVDEWEPKVDGKLDLFRQEVRGELGVAVAAIKRQLLSVTRRVEELELAGGLDDA